MAHDEGQRKDEPATVELPGVNLVEARDTLGELVSRVSFGRERIVITKHGKPAAVLVSIEDLAALQGLEQPASAKVA